MRSEVVHGLAGGGPRVLASGLPQTASSARVRVQNGLTRPYAVALLVWVLAALIAASLIAYTESSRIQMERGRVALLAGQAHEIEHRIDHALSATRTLAVLVRRGNGVVADFNEVARQMLLVYPEVAALQLAPKGVIRQSVPLAGHEKAIGHDLLLDPQRTKEAFLARDTGRLTLAGPFRLIQGGEAAVGRLPVFLDDAQGVPYFWGFVTALLKFPEVLKGVQLDQLSAQGLDFELSRVHPESGEKHVISAASPVPPMDPVTVMLRVPNATWTLNVAPVGGWTDSRSLSIKLALGLMFSLLLAMLAKLLVQLALHRRGLEQQVAERTRHVVAAQWQLQVTLDAIPDFLFELDLLGRFHTSHAPQSDPWRGFVMALSGTTVANTFSPAAADVVMAALREASEKGKSHGRQF